MPTITDVTHIEDFLVRAFATASEINEITNKISVIDDNVIVINAYHENLLQGVVGGTEQARMPFCLSSAPTGWIKSTALDDHMLRVTDGVSIPTGLNPTFVGNAEGGDWSITGGSLSSVDNHSHTIAHTHGLASHISLHSLSSHSHSMTHYHTAAHTHGTDTGYAHLGTPSSYANQWNYAGFTIATLYHGHSDGGHSHTLSSAGSLSWNSPGTSDAIVTGSSSSTNVSGASSVSSSQVENVGTHPIGFGDTWRPAYYDIIICEKN